MVAAKQKNGLRAQRRTTMEILVAGLDVGDKLSHVCVLSSAGEIEERAQLKTTKNGISGWFSGRKCLLVVLEVGTHSAWIERELQSLGHATIIANPRHLRCIYQSTKKNDKRDAEMLARVGRMDQTLLHRVEHRSKQTQKHLSLVRSRDVLVATRTKLINHVRGVVKVFGGRLPTSSADGFCREAIVEEIPEEARLAVAAVMDVIAGISQKIKAVEQELGELAAGSYPEVELLRTVPGVGLITALTFVLTVENPERFKRARTIGSYLGLVPRLDQSGDQDPQLSITKAGDPFLRRLLVQSAQYIMGPFGRESDLRTWALELSKRGGKRGKKRAVTALARKLAVVLLTMWKTNTLYNAHINSESHVTSNATVAVA